MNNDRAAHLEIIRNTECLTQDFALAVATVLFSVDRTQLCVFLTRKNGLGFGGRWALPGGAVHLNEPLDEAALRTVRQDSIDIDATFRQFRTFGRVDRYPGKRVVTVGFCALTRILAAPSNEWRWCSISKLPRLAIDHNRIVDKALGVLQKTALSEPIGEDVMAPNFTIGELHKFYEAILQRKIDPFQFRRQMWGMDLLIPLSNVDATVGRTQTYYRFNAAQYHRLQQRGIAVDF